MNFYGAPVLTGTFTSQPVAIPMVGLTVARPVATALAAPKHTSPTFGAFVLRKTSGGLIPPGAPSNVRIIIRDHP